jgi:NitT/TauT family transport system ATP-binding protein
MIEFQNVNKLYPGNLAPTLRNLSFSVDEGEFLIIVGPSGCGKSTVLRIIAGLEKTNGGEIQMPPDVAMVFQNGALFPWLNVFENVALGLRAKNMDDKKVEEICDRYIEMTGLTTFEEKFPHELSGGQKQRVGLARALAVEPKVLLLDEPFSALDTFTTEELHKDLIKIWTTTKKTIVMVSHSIEEAVTLADRIILMKAGEIEKEFPVTLPRPRREQESGFMHDVQSIRKEFFK